MFHITDFATTSEIRVFAKLLLQIARTLSCSIRVPSTSTMFMKYFLKIRTVFQKLGQGISSIMILSADVFSLLKMNQPSRDWNIKKCYDKETRDGIETAPSYNQL